MNPFIQPGQFSDQELPIARKIQQRRLQMLVHSYIYYKLDENIISDHAFNYWGHELANLQNKHPDIASRVCYAEAFKDWTGDTGAFLPLDDPWVINKAYQLLGREVEDEHKKILKASGEISGQKPKRQSTSKQRRNNVSERRRSLF